MPDVSSAELVPKKKKAVSVLKKATRIIIIMSEQSSFLYHFYNAPCRTLPVQRQGWFPLSFACTRTRCSNCRLNLNPLPWDWGRLQTAPSGISSLCLVQPAFTWLQIWTPNHWLTHSEATLQTCHVLIFFFPQRQTSTRGLAFKESGVFRCYFKANLTLLVLTHTKNPGLRKYAKTNKKSPFENLFF